MTNALRWALLSPLLALLGCASITYTPVLVDSPVPAAFRSPHAGNVPCGPHLAERKSCVALVRAEDWFSDTRIRVKRGQRYCFHVPADQVWFDAERRNSPPHGEAGSAPMWAMSWTKRHEKPWFTLMAGVTTVPVPTLRPVIWAGPPSREFTALLTPSTSLSLAARDEAPLVVVERTGALVLYPNDAWGPTGRPGLFYENNTGQAWVQVTRIAADQACTGEAMP